MKNFKSKIQLLACLSMLLCAVDLSAQHIEFATGDNNMIYSIDSSLNKITLGDYRTQVFTINAMLKYKEHCYNDSTEIIVYVDPNKKTYIGNGCFTTTLMGGYDTKKWVHKTPTFEDFIEWYIKNVQ